MKKTAPIPPKLMFLALMLLALIALPVRATPADATSRVVDMAHSWIDSLAAVVSPSESDAKDTPVDDAGVDIEPNG